MQPAYLSAQPALHAAVDKRPGGAPSQPRPLLAFSAKGCTHSLKLRDSFKLSPQLQLELGADLLLSSAAIGAPDATHGTITSHSEAAPSTTASSAAAAASNSVSSLTAADSASGLAASGGSAVAATGPPPAAEAVPPAAAEAPSAGALRFAGPWVALQWQVDADDRSKGVVRADAHHVSYSRHFRLGRKADWWAVPLDAKLGLTYSGQPHVALGTSNIPVALGLAAALLVAGKPVHIAHKEVGGLAVHFPLSFGGTRHQECLQERVEVDLTLRRAGRGLRCDLHQLNGVLRLREE